MKFFGLYKITNLANGKMYIGQHVTSDLDDGYMGSGLWIKNAVRKYGAENFRKEWLGFYEDQEELNYMERVFVDQTWVDRPDTYNLQLGGGVSSGPKHSDATKAKLSEKAKARFKDKTNHPMYGKKQSELHRLHNSVAHLGQSSPWKGRHFSDEQKSRISEARKRFCQENPGSTSRNHGKHWYTDGVRNVMAFNCPVGFERGRI